MNSAIMLKIPILLAMLVAPLAAHSEKPRSQYNPKHPFIIAEREAKKHGIDPKLVRAIMAHESYNCRVMVGETGDLGCLQISPANAKALGLDVQRLKTDKEYSIVEGVKILAWFKKRYKHRDGRNWYCRFNVGTRAIEGNVADLCARYLARVGH